MFTASVKPRSKSLQKIALSRFCNRNSLPECIEYSLFSGIPRKTPLITNFSSPDQFNLLWHIDSIIISWYGLRRTIITAVEEVTKIAYARVYLTHSSTNGQDFLKRLVYLTKEEIGIIHSDNGSEFAGHFAKTYQELNITQVYSRVRQPKDNASLERFNRTIQEEWLSPSLIGLDNISQANLDLTKWLIEYNAHHPHQALDYQTPLGYAQERFFRVLPMWSARILTCFGV